MSEDWDNLILLDACRFDQFKQLNTISGRLEARSSLGSATPQFLTENFEGTSHNDTVYVTANPMYRTRELGDVFYEVVDVWLTKWDEEYETVPPAAVAEAALEAYNEYPNKRLLIHFMQPHHPFIGDAAGELGVYAGYEQTRNRILGDETKEHNPTVWELLELGELDKKTVWNAYNQNLEIVLPHVKQLVSTFTERTVVTSDHGNLVGERIAPFGKPIYGHPFDTYTEELLKVPWLIIEGNERKQVQSGSTQHTLNNNTGVVSERLAHLGYTEL